jgi:hypothetical protein
LGGKDKGKKKEKEKEKEIEEYNREIEDPDADDFYGSDMPV